MNEIEKQKYFTLTDAVNTSVISTSRDIRDIKPIKDIEAPKYKTLTDAVRGFKFNQEIIDDIQKNLTEVPEATAGQKVQAGGESWLLGLRQTPESVRNLIYRHFQGMEYPNATSRQAFAIAEASAIRMNNEKALLQMRQTEEGTADSVIANLTSGALSVGEFALMGLATGGLGYALMGAQEAGDLSQEFVSKDIESGKIYEAGYKGQSLKEVIAADTYGAVAGWIEKGLGVEQSISEAWLSLAKQGARSATKKSVGEAIVRGSVGEGLEEFLQGEASWATGKIIGKEDKDFYEGFQDSLISGVYGAILGGAFGGASTGLENGVARYYQARQDMTSLLMNKGLEQKEAVQIADNTLTNAVDFITKELEGRNSLQTYFGDEWNKLVDGVEQAYISQGWEQRFPDRNVREFAEMNAKAMVAPVIELSNRTHMPLNQLLDLTRFRSNQNALFIDLPNMDDPKALGIEIKNRKAEIKRLRAMPATQATDTIKRLKDQVKVLELRLNNLTSYNAIEKARMDTKKATLDNQVLASSKPEIMADLNGIRQAQRGESFVYVGNNQVPVRYVVKPMAEVQASHIAGEANPNYTLKELQNRTRGTVTDDAILQNRAANLKPEELAESPNTQYGAPVVNKNGEVISGNGRMETLRRAYELGNTNYKEMLDSLGYNTEGIERPVLVRETIDDLTPEQQVAIAEASNVSETSAFDHARQAMNDAKLLKKGVSDPVTFADELPVSERQAYIRENGQYDLLALQRRFDDAVLAWIIGDTKTFDSLVLANRLNQKVIKGISMQGGNIVEFSKSNPTLGIKKDLRYALVKSASIKTRGHFIPAVQQQDIEEGISFNADALLYAMTFSNNSSELSNFIGQYVQTHQSYIDGQKDSFLADSLPKLSKEDITQQVLLNNPLTASKFDKDGTCTDSNLKAVILNRIPVENVGYGTIKIEPEESQLFQEQFNLANENARLDEIYPEYKGETITIDGKERTVYNSNGDRIAKSKEALENFYRWFGDSKVVDEQGRPLVVYHGTSKIFDAFAKEKKGELTGAKSAKEGFWFSSGEETARSYAEWSVENRELNKLIRKQQIMDKQVLIDWAEYDKLTEEIERLQFAEKQEQPIIMPVYLKAENVNTLDAKNQKFMDIQKEIDSLLQKSKDKDGVIIYNLVDAVDFDKVSEAVTHIMVKEPNQIKSTSNRGTYSESDNIYYQFAGEKAQTAALDELDRAKTPESTQDVANADAIVVFDDGTAMAYEPETHYQEGDEYEIKVATGDRTAVEEQKSKNAEYNKLAKEYYGTTNKLSETGYILTDGSLLDFSGKKFGGSPNNRSIDHREIVDALDKAGMEEFINSGNIRYLPEGDKILLSNEPTPQQYKVIERIINNNGGNITIELMNDANKWGMNRNDYYGEYEDTTFNKVKRDIKAFYTGEGVREITTFFQSAFAGSRVDYDTPSLEAIGSGEGNQAHGWGLYYALNKDVAEKYRESFVITNDNTTPEGLATQSYYVFDKNKSEAIKSLEEYYNTYKKDLYKNALELLKSDDFKPLQGQVHEVDIPENPYLLDEQKPFSEQSDIVKKGIIDTLNSMNLTDEQKARFRDNIENRRDTGKEIYEELTLAMAKSRGAGLQYSSKENMPFVSKALAENGVKGITYFGRQDGRCFVIFNPDDVKVIQKFYQRGKANINGYFDAELKTIVIGSNFNFGTLQHEFAHFFLDRVFNLYKSGAGTPEFNEWFSQLSSILDIKADQSRLRVEQQEQFARMTESYLFNKAEFPESAKPAMQMFFDWCPKEYNELLSIGWKDDKGIYHNSVFNKESLDLFNDMYSLVPELGDSPLVRTFTNETNRNGTIIPADAEQRKEREKLIGETPVETVTAEATQDSINIHNTPDPEVEEAYKEAIETEQARKKTPVEKFTQYVRIGRGTNTREEMDELAQDYIKKHRENAERVAFGNPIPSGYEDETGLSLGYVENNTGIDRAVLILNLMNEYAPNSPEYNQLYHNFAIYRSYASKSAGLTNDVNTNYYLKGYVEINKALTQKAALLKYGKTDNAVNLWNRDIDRFISQNIDKVYKTEPESVERDKAIAQFMDDARAMFGSDEPVLLQEEIRIKKAKDKQAFIDWANRVVKQIAKGKMPPMDEAKLMDLSVKAQKASKFIDSNNVDEAVAASQDIRAWQDFVNQKGLPESFADKIIGTYLPSAMLSSPSTHALNAVSNFFNNVAIRAATRLHYGSNVIRGDVLEKEYNRLKAIYAESGHNLSEDHKPDDVSRLHGEHWQFKKPESALGYLSPMRLLGWSDFYFRAHTYVDTLARIATQDAKGDPKKALELFNEYKQMNSVNQRAKEARLQAIMTGHIAVFTNNGTLANISAGMRHYLDYINLVEIGKGGHKGFGTLIMPFAKVPANIVGMGIQAVSSPFKLLGKWTGLKKDWTIQDSIALTNFGLFSSIVGIYLMAGLDYEPPYEPPHKYDPEKPYDSIKIGGVWVSVESFGALANPLRFTFTMLDMISNGKKVEPSLIKAIEGLKNDVPFTSVEFDNDYMKRKPADWLVSATYNQLSKAVPAAVKKPIAWTNRALGYEIKQDSALKRKIARQYGLDGKQTTINDYLTYIYRGIKVDTKQNL